MPKPPTLQDLLARFQISEGQLKAKLSDEHLLAIARFINHGILGPELGLTPPEMEAIEADGRTEELRRLNTLRKWKEKYSFMATYQELLEALFRCGMADHAEKVLSILKDAHPDHESINQHKPPTQQDTSSTTTGKDLANLLYDLVGKKADHIKHKMEYYKPSSNIGHKTDIEILVHVTYLIPYPSDGVTFAPENDHNQSQSETRDNGSEMANNLPSPGSEQHVKVDESLPEEGTAATTVQNEIVDGDSEQADERSSGYYPITNKNVINPSKEHLITPSCIKEEPTIYHKILWKIKSSGKFFCKTKQKKMIIIKSYQPSQHPQKEKELLQGLKRMKGAEGKVPTPPVGEEYVLSRQIRYSTKYGAVAGNTAEVMMLVSVGDEFPTGVMVKHRDRDEAMAEKAVAEYGHLPAIAEGLYYEISADIMARASQVLQDKNGDLVGLYLDTERHRRPKTFYLSAIEDFLKHCQQPQATLIYIGNSELDTGNWCFKDGTITFKEIFDLYIEKSPQKALCIMPDCSHSGQWVDDCAKMLDNFRIPPCGHRARERGVLIKVLASCKPDQQAVEPCFSVEGIKMDEDGILIYYMNKTVNEAVTFSGADFTKLTCCRGPNESCHSEKALENWTWQQAIHGELKSRVFIVRGTDKGKQVWRMVLLSNNSEEYREKFNEQVATGNIDVAEWGYVIQSGWGEDPPQSVREKIICWITV